MSEKKTIKLLFLLPSFTFGGAERTSLNLLNGINRDKFKICLITSKNIFAYFEHLNLDEFIPLEDLGISTWFTTFRKFLSDISKVASLMKQKKPELVFGMMHYPSALLVFAKKWYNLPVKVVVSPRGPSTAYLHHFEEKMFRKTYLKWIFTFFCRHADWLVVASNGMREECIREYIGDPSKITVIPNSIDLDTIRQRFEEPTDIDIPPGYLLLSSSGRLEREKNLPFLLKAFSVAGKQYAMKLIIIGDGTERENLERIAQTLKIKEDIIFIGHQRNPFKFVKQSDIYIHTCLFEGFANSIIEALACGVPVITIDCPYGPRDIIKDGETGFLVPLDDEEALVKAMLDLAGNKDMRMAMGKRGTERAEEFSVQKMVDGYERVLEALTQNR
jgi:glycosyltransferase involved in cell wall biosynthesis